MVDIRYLQKKDFSDNVRFEARFERIGGRPFKLEHVPEPALLSQFQEATDSMQKSFAALMLGYLHGDAINMAPAVDTFALKLSNVDDYARSVLAQLRETTL
jgi:hypothetical protein